MAKNSTFFLLSHCRTNKCCFLCDDVTKVNSSQRPFLLQYRHATEIEKRSRTSFVILGTESMAFFVQLFLFFFGEIIAYKYIIP